MIYENGRSITATMILVQTTHFLPVSNPLNNLSYVYINLRFHFYSAYNFNFIFFKPAQSNFRLISYQFERSMMIFSRD